VKDEKTSSAHITDDDKCIEALCNDIRNHVSNIDPGFYGYAIFPWDMHTQPEPSSSAAVVNREENIAPENREDDYYRFCPNEWSLWQHEGFEESAKELSALYQNFRATHKEDPESIAFDDEELAFHSRFYSIHLKALERLKSEGIFSEDVYLVVWVSDSSHEIMDRSAKLLNSPAIYKRFSNQFKDYIDPSE